jgi:succinate dehydrogenase/fumarate reductase flavoprotein subunit
MRTLELNIAERDIDVWIESAAVDLLLDSGEVIGVAVSIDADDSTVEVEAVGGVVLATAGFEFSRAMLQDYLELPVVYPVGHPWNTGDGIRMSQRAGADLWHMWHFHGSYGFKFADHDFAFRHHLGGARHDDRLVAWIVVDQNGRRFMNEVPRAPQDTSWRDLAHLDDETGRFDRVPSWLIFDETTRKLGPIGKTTWSRPTDRYDWSDDNQKEIDKGWIISAPTLEELAVTIGVPAAGFHHTIAEWNRSVMEGRDPLGRPPGVCAPIDAAPFHAIETWPVCTNTQGGPRHDEFQRVLDPTGAAIPGLYAAGELGSFFGHIYLLGGNLTEAAVGGTTAGALAARRATIDTPPNDSSS